ncbi:MAG: SulP family inorganic anion transporter [Planctomycetes bacterium]|jgi:high affinity sulfate transporter 1|nr:SulP family inorganic anion transporter [Planctomycetota bacterium]
MKTPASDRPVGGGTRSPGRGLLRWIPASGWLRGYQASFLRVDLVAGVTLAAYMLPAGIGDASLANLPPEAGLYACLFGGLVFWLFCSSRHTSITVTSAISLLLGSSLGALSGGDPARFSALAALTALLVAGMAFLSWLVRAGAIVNFVSESVLDGWKTGVALFLASTQLPKLFGFGGSHGDFWERAAHFLRHLDETKTAALGIGLAALVVLVLGKVFLPKRPVALFVVVGGIVAAALADLGAHGVKLLGEVPQGLPAPGWPAVHLSDLNEVLPLAMACFLIAAVETSAIGRMFSAKHRNRLDANQELLALSVSNLAAGLFRGYPVSGGMSQSLVNEAGGARTPLSGLIAAVVLTIVAVFLSGLLRYLPQPVLAAVVLVAVAGLFKFAALKHLFRADRTEFAVAIAALLGVLGSGLLRGVMIGAVLSLVLLLRRASRPHVATLGRIPGTKRFADFEHHADLEKVPGVVVFRPEASLLYFNVEGVCDVIRGRLGGEAAASELVLVDLSASPLVDIQSAHVLADLADEVTAAGARFEVVDARAAVRERFRMENVVARLGLHESGGSITDALGRLGRAGE